MTRKDYELIARALYKARERVTEDSIVLAMWRECVRHIACALNDENPRFNINKFYIACGWEEKQ